MDEKGDLKVEKDKEEGEIVAEIIDSTGSQTGMQKDEKQEESESSKTIEEGKEKASFKTREESEEVVSSKTGEESEEKVSPKTEEEKASFQTQEEGEEKVPSKTPDKESITAIVQEGGNDGVSEKREEKIIEDEKIDEGEKAKIGEEKVGEEKSPTVLTDAPQITTSDGDKGEETTETAGEDTTTDQGGTEQEDKDVRTSKTPTEKESKQSSQSSRTSSRDEGKRSVSAREKERRRERRKKKKQLVPKLRKRMSKTGTTAEQYLQAILMSYFQALDPAGSGFISADDFWSVLLSPELNFQLSNEDVDILHPFIQIDLRGMVAYTEFVSIAQQLITSVYQGQPDVQTNWVELRGADGTVVVYNKKTGEIIDNAESGMDLFEETIQDLFNTADTKNVGYITTDDFTQMLETKDMFLKPDDKQELLKRFPEGKVVYKEFQPIAKEVILRVYRAKDESDSEWVQVSSPRVGWFWLNKVTGETRRDIGITEERDQEAALINQAYSQIDDLNLQLEQERARTREMENQVAIANEELEATATQLDETGRQLDEANNDLLIRETEIHQLQAVISEKDQFIFELTAKVAEVTALEEQLSHAHYELEQTKQMVYDRENTLAGKEQKISDLKLQADAIIDELKNAHGVIDARESSINNLQYNLTNEQGRVKELQQHMPSLETRLSAMVNEHNVTQNSLEEKTGLLQQARKNLKIAREKNNELEKEVTKLSQVNEKLKNAECEIKTLKSFLTTKTAMVERKKKETQELRLKMSEIESRDNRRAIILADVLEKTARTYQQQLATTTPDKTPLQLPENAERPISAPIIPLEEILEFQATEDPLSVSYESPLRTHQTVMTRGNAVPNPPAITSSSPRKKTHIKARTVPRLPPIRSQKSDFAVPTKHEIKRYYKQMDSSILPHTSGVDCRCKLCTINRSPGKQQNEFANLTSGEMTLAALRLETDTREYQLSQQIKLGQRILIQVKKSMYDLEPQKLTGVVKYIGKIDSEYIDNRIYVGVKLDEPVGNNDGLYKGKRYFTCPPNHGRMVRITSVIAVMPNKSVIYKPLQTNPRTSPYNNPGVHKKTTPLRVA